MFFQDDIANTQPELYPGSQKQLSEEKYLWQMITWYATNSLEGQVLAADKSEMGTIQA